MGDNGGDASRIGSYLQNIMSVGVKDGWLGGVVDALRDSVPGFSSLPVEKQAEHLMVRFLSADLRACGSGCLPQDIEALRAGDILRGR